MVGAFEKDETTSAVSPYLGKRVDPTAIAVEIHAGDPIPSIKPLFPLAITVATPMVRS
jgi:hypothetical protein